MAVALTVLLFAPFAYYIPKLGARRHLDAGGLAARRSAPVGLPRAGDASDAWIVGLTAVSAVAISVEFCILIGVFLSFVLYVPRAARVHMTELIMTPERVIRERISTDVPCGRIRIFSLEGELFFGAAPELEEHLDAVAEAARRGRPRRRLTLKRARNPDRRLSERARSLHRPHAAGPRHGPDLRRAARTS